MKFKELRKKYQGKYYLGYEVSGSETYLFIKKICVTRKPLESSFITYSDVIFTQSESIVFEQNREWFFGTDFIARYGYKEISKSLFIRAVNKFGFKRLEKNDKEYSTDMIKADSI